MFIHCLIVKIFVYLLVNSFIYFSGKSYYFNIPNYLFKYKNMNVNLLKKN